MEEKVSTVSSKEYLRVFAAVEGGAYVGANCGVYLSDLLTNKNWLIASGTLSGDYIGGTVGQIASYWYNNRQKFRDEDGKFQYRSFGKDVLKILIYDSPVTATTYALAAKVTHYMVEKDWDNALVAAGSTLTVMTIWNLLNYFVYSAIKSGSDERWLKRMVKKLRCGRQGSNLRRH